MSADEDELEDGLTPKQHAVLACLVGGASAEEAAEQTGAGERTIRRWAAEHDAFRRELKVRQREVMAGATRELQSAASTAVRTLKDVMGDAKASHGSKVSAAKAVLESAYRAAELDDLAERLDALEAVALPRKRNEGGA